MVVVHKPLLHSTGELAGHSDMARAPVRLPLGAASVPATPHAAAVAAQVRSAHSTCGLPGVLMQAAVPGHMLAAATHEPSRHITCPLIGHTTVGWHTCDSVAPHSSAEAGISAQPPLAQR